MPLDIESMLWLDASQATEASGSHPLPSLGTRGHNHRPRAKAQKGGKRRVDDDDDTSECDTASEADEDDRPAEPVAPIPRTCSRISGHWSVMM